jgi:hypothetical protein
MNCRRFLCCCARSRLATGGCSAVGVLVCGPVDWQRSCEGGQAWPDRVALLPVAYTCTTLLHMLLAIRTEQHLYIACECTL